MELIRSWRIVDNHDAVYTASQTRQVLHEAAATNGARITKQPPSKYTTSVQEVDHRVSVLGQAGRKQDTLEQLSDTMQKLVDVWPLQNINLVYGTIEFYRYHEIRPIYRLKRAVDEGFVEVDNHTHSVEVSRV